MASVERCGSGSDGSCCIAGPSLISVQIKWTTNWGDLNHLIIIFISYVNMHFPYVKPNILCNPSQILRKSYVLKLTIFTPKIHFPPTNLPTQPCPQGLPANQPSLPFSPVPPSSGILPTHVTQLRVALCMYVEKDQDCPILLNRLCISPNVPDKYPTCPILLNRLCIRISRTPKISYCPCKYPMYPS